MMKHKIEIAPNLAIYIDGERVIGSKPHGLFLITEMIVSDEDLKRLSDRCLEVISDRKTENSSGKLNNCETCNHYKLTCDLFSEICKYEPIAEDCSTVDKDINVCSKDDSQLVKESTEVVKDLVKDKPQTDYTPDCPFCKRYGTEDCLGSDCITGRTQGSQAS